ncbi:MAG TPA: hypothetical protein P5123_11790 [Spirochaetota bacterium]|nr:hypothetical protein [Spirochaetota bacterium]
MKSEEFLRILLFLLSVALLASIYLFFSRRSTLADLLELSEAHETQRLALTDISRDLDAFREQNNLYETIEVTDNEQVETVDVPPSIDDIHNRLRATALEHAQAKWELAPRIKKLFRIVHLAGKWSLILGGIYLVFIFGYGFHSRY